ncbi:MAG: M18 family aminopeptidase, partial [Lachnospiraceae bacterium]|nr:M18 family aminopeptidase [Lachnospiraceae bacterium]
YVYNAEEGVRVGMNQEFFSAPRLDNQTSCYALLRAIAEGVRVDGINVIALYDNEEIGSRTKQGADSMLLMLLLEKIYAALGMDKSALSDAILRSFLFSVDVAHALHPNHPEKYDPVNRAPDE